MALAPAKSDGILPGGCTDWAGGRQGHRDVLSAAARTLRAGWSALGLNRAELATPIGVRWAVGVPVAVVALIFTGALVEPAPASEATGTAAVVDSILANVLVVGLVATVMGAASLKRWGLAGAFGVATFTLGLAAACPVTGHHTLGVWFAAQSACVLGATGVATMGLLRTRR